MHYRNSPAADHTRPPPVEETTRLVIMQLCSGRHCKSRTELPSATEWGTFHRCSVEEDKPGTKLYTWGEKDRETDRQTQGRRAEVSTERAGIWQGLGHWRETGGAAELCDLRDPGRLLLTSALLRPAGLQMTLLQLSSHRLQCTREQ